MTKLPVKQIANLGNIILTDEELIKISKQLDETVSYVENLSELDTSNVAVTASPTGTKNVFFEDGVKNERKLKPGVYKVGRII